MMEAKKPKSFRLRQRTNEALLHRAEIEGKSETLIVEEAIELFLSFTPNDDGSEVQVSSRDVEGLLEVMKVIGGPISLKFCLQILDRQISSENK